jgi:MFS family permease
MTLWKQGRPLFPFLPGFGSFLDLPASASGRACCPIGTALVTEFAPRRIRATMIVMGVRGRSWGGGLAGLVAAQFMSIYGSRARDRPARAAGAPSFTLNHIEPGCCLRNIGCRLAPDIHSRGNMGINSLHVARQQTGPVCANRIQE